MTRAAETAVPLHPLLAERWSPRAFDPNRPIEPRALTALLEAARWAPSASNTQPWRFVVTERGSAAFAALHATLMPGNTPWAGAAAALILVAAETADEEGTARPWAAYDTGSAVAALTAQAGAEGLGVHQMGGFDRQAAAERFSLPARLAPMTVLAVGVAADPSTLPAPYAEREVAPRTRLPLETLLLPADRPLAA